MTLQEYLAQRGGGVDIVAPPSRAAPTDAPSSLPGSNLSFLLPAIDPKMMMFLLDFYLKNAGPADTMATAPRDTMPQELGVPREKPTEEERWI